ncbi:MAG TPA: hypothetical protein PLO78_06470 [Candidatus Omnitrophota bacterium]|nr:hypothetical protein [Candidatus Omnitrophota bacterium]
MEVDFCLLADRAEAVGGKLYVLGGAFDTIFAKQLPVIHKSLSVVIKLSFDAAEVDRDHDLRVIILDGDGHEVVAAGGPLHVGKNRLTPKGWPEGFLAVLNFENIKFEKFDTYGIRVLFNNTTHKTIRFRVAQIP